MAATEIKGFNIDIEDSKLWRYMDFAKFIDLISTQYIFLSRIDKLEDVYEGTIPKAYVDKVNEINNPIVNSFFDSRFNLNKAHRQWIYINCWHMNEVESAAMWKLYSKTNESIAIETTYNTLKSILPDCVIIGKVKYFDYNSEYENTLNSINHFFQKRKSFIHEQEVRLLIEDEEAYKNNSLSPSSKNSSNGIKVPINIKQLINTIHVSPTAPKWFFTLVKKIVNEDYKLNIPVKQSDLYNDPIY